jgi:imidazolonepropionase-like amidohydrolase
MGPGARMIILSNISKLYDGKSAGADAVHRDVDLWIDGERIHALRPHGAGPAPGPDHVVVDGSAWTVTPGMIDCHGHITLWGLLESDMDRMNAPDGLLIVERILYETLVRGGVTTLRDVGGATHSMKRMVDDGLVIGPRLKISICMLSTTGGHADFRGPDRCHGELSKLFPAARGRPSSIVDGPWRCRQRVREIVANGADLIKICTSPGVASPSDKLEHEEFSAEEIHAVCVQAEGRGLRVAAHAHSARGIELAIENGVYDIQHISWMDERLAELALKNGCVVTPTSWVMRELMRQTDLIPAVAAKAKQVAEVHGRAVELARSAGIPILAGTDPVLPRMHGRNYMEIVALVEDGLTPLEAWHGATGLAAGVIGQEDSGTLAEGQRADLLVCDRDVVDEPQQLDRGALIEVVKDGVGHRGFVEALPQRSFATAAHELLDPKGE